MLTSNLIPHVLEQPSPDTLKIKKIELQYFKFLGASKPKNIIRIIKIG